jgi:hypothetical protein
MPFTARPGLISNLSSRSKNKQKVKSACRATISASQILLQVAQEAAGVAGIPGLKASLAGLLFVIDVVKVNRHSPDSSFLLTAK